MKTSPPTSEWLEKKMAELEAKKHCRCDGSPLHGHCLTCNSIIGEGASTGPTCEERKKRTRFCSKCHAEFYLEATKAEISTPHRFGFCGEECYKPYLDSILKSSGVPPKFMSSTLDSFKPYTKGLEESLKRIQQWVDGDLVTGLYLVGTVGAGKTHLVIGMLRALGERRGLCGRFVSARNFVMLCQTAFTRRESAEDVVNELLQGSRFLILDDLSSEKGTDYARQSLLHLVDECYGRGVVLVITSNMDLQALSQIDDRIASRIAEMGDRLRFDEQDYRVVIAKDRVKKDDLPKATDAKNSSSDQSHSDTYRREQNLCVR